MLARGIHRKLVVFFTIAIALGAAAGAVAHGAMGAGKGAHSLLCVSLGVLAVLWPLSWVATWQVARPLRHLAAVAAELRQGQLERRADLPAGEGEVGEVGAALRGMAERVAEQLRDQRALMAAVSHELRSPLGRARVLVEMIREGTAPPGVADELEAEIDAMDGLVGDLLAAARIDFEAVAPRALDPVDLARRAVEIAGLPPDTLRADGAIGPVRADATLLARALVNLLRNARQHGGGAVSLHLAAADGRVRFEVRDDGPGFVPGDEARAFEPFWRGATADGRPKPSGVGLGLALVRRVAEAHGGAVGAGNRDEGGARVWIEVPAGDGVGAARPGAA